MQFPTSFYFQSGSRLFGFVGAGATFGQLFGSLFAAGMAWVGPCMYIFSFAGTLVHDGCDITALHPFVYRFLINVSSQIYFSLPLS